MRHALTALAFICAPFVAQAENTQAECVAALDEVAAIASAFNASPDYSTAEEVDGWCIVSNAKFGDASLTDVKFRWIDQQAIRTFEILVDQLNIEREVFELEARFEFDESSNEVSLINLSARSTEGHGVAVTGLFTMGTAEQLGVSAVQARVSSLSAQVFVTSDVLSFATTDDIEETRDVVANAMNGANFGQIDRQSRREATRFLTALPNAQGRMDVSVQSAQGTEIAQFIPPFIGVAQSQLGTALDRALDGVQVQLRWNPGRM